MENRSVGRAHLEPRKEIRALTPGIHGGTKASELSPYGLSEDSISDFSASVSPFGPAPSVLDAIRGARVDAYPDPEAPELTAALAAAAGVSEDRIIPTSGSLELLQMIALAYLSPGRKLLTLSPSFGEYAPAAQLLGAPIETFSLVSPPANATISRRFSLDAPEFLRWTRENAPGVLIINDPHNPTGLAFGPSLIEEVLRIDAEILVVVDEAYREFQRHPSDLRPHLDSERLILMRSLTKAHSIPGVRIGYGIASSSVIANLRKARLPWTVSSLAQAAGIAAVKEATWLEESIDACRGEKEFLAEELSRLGLQVLPSEANFFLVRFGDGAAAGRLRDRLLRKGLRLRSCDSFGLPDHLRISPRTREENLLLLNAIKEEIGSPYAAWNPSHA